MTDETDRALLREVLSELALLVRELRTGVQELTRAVGRLDSNMIRAGMPAQEGKSHG